MINISRRTAVKGLGAASLLLPTGKLSWAQGTPQRGGTLTVGLVNNNSKTFDPRHSVQLDEIPIKYLIFDTLVHLNPDFTIGPELATSWEIEDEGKRYVFHLREGVTFSDGTPFDAEAVKWNMDQSLDEEVGSYLRNHFGPIIDSVEAVDPLTVVFNLKTPYPSLLADLGSRLGWLASPTAGEKFGEDFGRNPVGAGAFMLTEWSQGSHITLERNPNYWDADNVYLDKIVYQTLPNQILGLRRLQIGEIDFVGSLGPGELRQIPSDSDVVVEKLPLGRWYALQWQVDNPPFDDLTLRRAIAHAIDRDRINQVAMDGQGTIANGILPPTGVWWADPEQAQTFTYDPEKAKALLDEAGWDYDTPITLYTSSAMQYSRIATLVAEQLTDIGLTVNLEVTPSSETYAKVVQRLINFVPTAWVQRPDPSLLANFLLATGGGGNTTGYSDPQTDELLAEARASLDQERRKELYHQVNERFMENLPYIPLYFSVEYQAHSDRLKGFVPSGDTFPRFRNVWLEG